MWLQILSKPDTLVVAGVRTPDKASELQKLAEKHANRLHVVKLDLAEPETVNVRLHTSQGSRYGWRSMTLMSTTDASRATDPRN